jgi:energy-coupling factor transport system ATP-binding protein
MKVSLAGVRAVRGDWSLSADGVFEEGIHLVSGDIGSGKSTLALLLAGLFPQASGTAEREGIATTMIAFQFPEFHVTGPDLVAECRSWGVDPVTVLASAGLAGREATNPLNLSRGELKRLVLACILAKNHDLLVLDEPFSSLDCTEKERCVEHYPGGKQESRSSSRTNRPASPGLTGSGRSRTGRSATGAGCRQRLAAGTMHPLS